MQRCLALPDSVSVLSLTVVLTPAQVFSTRPLENLAGETRGSGTAEAYAAAVSRRRQAGDRKAVDARCDCDRDRVQVVARGDAVEHVERVILAGQADILGRTADLAGRTDPDDDEAAVAGAAAELQRVGVDRSADHLASAVLDGQADHVLAGEGQDARHGLAGAHYTADRAFDAQSAAGRLVAHRSARRVRHEPFGQAAGQQPRTADQRPALRLVGTYPHHLALDDVGHHAAHARRNSLPRRQIGRGPLELDEDDDRRLAGALPAGLPDPDADRMHAGQGQQAPLRRALDGAQMFEIQEARRKLGSAHAASRRAKAGGRAGGVAVSVRKTSPGIATRWDLGSGTPAAVTSSCS